MTSDRLRWPTAGATLAFAGALSVLATAAVAQLAPITPATMSSIGTVDERYQSYDVEMPEITGGKFWRPYGPELEAALRQPAPHPGAQSSGDTASGMNPALHEYRPPIDVANLRELAAALGPACVQGSGTRAHTTSSLETGQPPQHPPHGFMGVLTQQQWKGVTG